MIFRKYTTLIYLLISFYSCNGSITEVSDGKISSDIFIDPGNVDRENCLNNICDIDPQCGCPEGTMCTIVPGLGRGCAIAGTGKDGAPCTLLECAPGYLCQNGLCRKACRRDSDCPQIGACYKYIGNGDYKVCNIICNHVTNEGCPEGYRCDVRWPDNYTYPFHDCNILEGNGKLYDSCTVIDSPNPEISLHKDCSPGYMCDSVSCYRTCLNPGTFDPICPPEEPCCLGWGDGLVVDGVPLASCSIADRCE